MRRYYTLLFAVLLNASFLSIIYFLPATSQDIEHRTYLPSVPYGLDVSWRWHEPVDVTLNPAPFHDPLSIIDRDGRLHIFWETLTSPRLIYHTYLTSEGWTEIEPIAQTIGTSFLLFPPVISDDGILHFIWRNYLGYGIDNPYRLMYAQFDGQNWSTEEEIVRTSNEMQAMVQTANPAEIHVTYVGTNFFTDIHNTIRRDGDWTNNVEIDPSHPVSLVWPDRYGGVHLYQTDYYTNNLYYSYWQDGLFSIDNMIIEGELLGRETQLDGQKNLHIFWIGQVPIVGGQIQGLYYQCLSNNHRMSSEQVLTGETEVDYSVIKASDNQNKIVLAWKETQSTLIQLMVRDGCEIQKTKVAPFPEEISWGLKSLAISPTPRQTCVFAQELYSDNYTAICADIIN